MAHTLAVQSHAQVAVQLTPYELQQYAKTFVAAKMFTSRGKELTVDEAFTIISVGSEYGFGPGQSMVSLHLMDGKPELSADAQARFIKASGKYEYRVTEHTDEACELTVLAVPSGEIIGVERYTMADAERQELLRPSRSGKPTAWQKVPRNMLFARCVSNVTAFHCPDAIPMRAYTFGEINGEQRLDEVPREYTPAEIAKVSELEHQVVANIEAVMLAEEALPLANEALAMVEQDMEAEALRQRFIEDSANFSEVEKDHIRTLVREAGVPFKASEIVKLMQAKGYSEARPWLAFEFPFGEVAVELTEADVDAPPAGMTSRDTGSQQATRTLSDQQLKMLHARMGEIPLSEQERRNFLIRFAQVESTKHVASDMVTELLHLLTEMKIGGDSARILMTRGMDEDDDEGNQHGDAA